MEEASPEAADDTNVADEHWANYRPGAAKGSVWRPALKFDSRSQRDDAGRGKSYGKGKD